MPNVRSSARICEGGVRSQGVVGGVAGEPLGLFHPGLAHELVGRQSAECLQAARVVVGVQEQLQVHAELVVRVVVVPVDRRVLDRAVQAPSCARVAASRPGRWSTGGTAVSRGARCRVVRTRTRRRGRASRPARDRAAGPRRPQRAACCRRTGSRGRSARCGLRTAAPARARARSRRQRGAWRARAVGRRRTWTCGRWPRRGRGAPPPCGLPRCPRGCSRSGTP